MMRIHKHVLRFFFGLVFIILPIGCGGGSNGPSPTDPEDALALNNPLMGWAPSGAAYKDYNLPHRLVFYYFSWRELEPAKGDFQWQALESKFKLDDWYKKKDKVRAVLRFRMDSPTTDVNHMDIPDWLYEAIGRQGTWYRTSNNTGGFSPNYQNPKLIAEHDRVLEALGSRYNKDPRIAFVEVGSIGHWGEFHTSNISDANEPGYFPPVEIAQGKYAKAYHTYFPDKIVQMRYPCEMAQNYNKNGCWGLYNDMMGNPRHTREWFLDWIAYGHDDKYGVGGATQHHPPMLPDWWTRGASGGEFGDILVFTGVNFGETLKEIEDCHTTWLGPACPPAFSVYPGYQENIGEFTGPSFVARVNAALRTMGYRFKVQQVTHADSVRAGASLSITMTVINKGVAPFYYLWPFELSLADSNENIVFQTETPEDIRTWLPGNKTVAFNIAVPANLPKGQYTLCIAILDPDDSPKKPAVDFAMPGKRPDGRFALDRLTIN